MHRKEGFLQNDDDNDLSDGAKPHLHPGQAADQVHRLCHNGSELCGAALDGVQGGQVYAGQQSQVWGADQVGELEILDK